MCVWRGGCQSHRVRRPQSLEKKTAEAESSRGPSAYQLNALPLGQTGSSKDIAEKVNVMIFIGAAIATMTLNNSS